MSPWDRACTALRLLQLDPVGLGGIVLRARCSPVRDAFLDRLPKDVQRISPHVSLEALEGGIDVAASLREGHLVNHTGLLEHQKRLLLLTLAERTPQITTAKICDALDTGLLQGLVAVDESAELDEAIPIQLADRLAFHVSLDGVQRSEIAHADPASIAPSAINRVIVEDGQIDALVSLALSLGIHSLRAPRFAIAAARAHAALEGRKSVEERDVLVAVELVYASRAEQLPAVDPDPTEAPPETAQETAQEETPSVNLPQDLLLKAIETALPDDLLNYQRDAGLKGRSGAGAGGKRIGNRRGRPLPAREVAPSGTQSRIDLMATLRAAVPWQTLRRANQDARDKGPIIRPSDLRYKRYEEHSDRLLIFAVDASGSAALARLSEAKGAVELLLSEAYARRDHVTLIAFRRESAEMLLPPTRSLVQTKRRLGDLPGGGATPLAHGLKLALETAETSRRKGLSPMLIILTDGRGNIALDGTADRQQAAEDVQRLARAMAVQGLDSIVIDTNRRPDYALQELARTLRGQYTSLPRADAQKLSKTVAHALAD
ncbi:MAG: magnesium chelatase subunit D [Pseudomonadota bacterium]